MTWQLDGEAITDFLAIATPSAEQEAWATLCANAVNAAITTRLGDYTPSAEADAELARSALLDGAEAFRAKDSRMGILTVGPEGEPMRVSTDILWSLPVLSRYVPPGIG